MGISRHLPLSDATSSPLTPSPILTRNFVLAFAGHFCIGLAFWPYVLLPLFLGNLGYDSFFIGILMGTASVAGILVRFWVCGELDRRGCKHLLIGTSVLFICVNLGYVFVHEAGPLIYGLRLAHGLSIGTLFAAIMTFAATIIPETRRTEGLAYFGISGHVPGAIGVMLGEWLIQSGGFQPFFIFGAIMSALAAIFFTLLTEPNGTGCFSHRQSLWTIVHNQRFVALWMISLTFSLGLASYFTFLKPFAASIGLTNVSFFFTTYSTVVVFTRIFGARIPQQLGETFVLTVSFGCLAIGILLITLISTPWHLMLTGMLCGIGHGYGFPILSSIIIDIADGENRGSVMTFYTLLFDLGFLIGAPLWGLLVSLGGYDVMLVAAATVVSVGIVTITTR